MENVSLPLSVIAERLRAARIEFNMTDTALVTEYPFVTWEVYKDNLARLAVRCVYVHDARKIAHIINVVHHDPQTLRPCPMCGSEAEHKTTRSVLLPGYAKDYFYVECAGCGTSTSRKHEREGDAASAWNWRKKS